MTNSRDQRYLALSRRPHHDLFVEAPQVFETAAAARHDQHIRARDFSTRLKRVEAANGGGDFGGTALALYPDRPDDDVGGIALCESSQHVADDSTGWRGHDADDFGEKGERLLAGFLE